mgnify:CR=1 FL=1
MKFQKNNQILMVIKSKKNIIDFIIKKNGLGHQILSRFYGNIITVFIAMRASK